MRASQPVMEVLSVLGNRLIGVCDEMSGVVIFSQPRPRKRLG